MDPVLISTLGAVAFTESVKFLYGQAADLLRARRERRRANSSDTKIEVAISDSAPLDANPGRLTADLATLERVHSELAEVGMELAPFAVGDAEISAQPTEVEELATQLRSLLEEVYSARLTFQGEDRVRTGVELTANMRIGKLRGSATGIEAERISGNSSLVSDQEIDEVTGGGTAIGIKAKDIDG